mmetsp:Transcript_30074/g.53318  ORF Transcript_30074/g.53318 Transcript_30074/m.53318 type:complete len:259 (+) Transcript_30074:3516-4292(+)|eukprot:CAMPEP_0204899142 /NCGR_PEP_ID=MMETSP1397-20131031/1682_1 /ASSEMBLY_ACC=CAM_ASM_000891 /TAXON_ID=49980 /ORGANISM="Climacostomum Climacostomum virens, Strain Stock W-24" /LENGTH=258 /DNA_ID=CAMNT_0052067059 /DNA_START=1215 /DNA_END=1991 /DNA_ORIENTATION=-
MVNVQHILQGSLSNSASALGIFEEDMSCTGLGKVLWGKTAGGVMASTPVVIIISDPGTLQHLPQLEIVQVESPWQSQGNSVIVDAIPRTARKLPSLNLAAVQKPVFIDSLELLALAYKDLQADLSALVTQQTGCYLVINSDVKSPIHEFCRHFASIFVKVERHRGPFAILRCSHSRLYTKYSCERWRLNLEGMKFAKYKVIETDSATHTASFRLELTEAEKKMKDATPLPYEKASRLVTIDAEDEESPDDEGDEDEFY